MHASYSGLISILISPTDCSPRFNIDICNSFHWITPAIITEPVYQDNSTHIQNINKKTHGWNQTENREIMITNFKSNWFGTLAPISFPSPSPKIKIVTTDNHQLLLPPPLSTTKILDETLTRYYYCYLILFYQCD